MAGAWSTTRAVDDGRLRWATLTGALLGLAFLTDSLVVTRAADGQDPAPVVVVRPSRDDARLTDWRYQWWQTLEDWISTTSAPPPDR